jgi:hypothetical protein
VDPGRELAEASIAEAEALMASLFAAASAPAPARARPRRPVVPAAPAAAPAGPGWLRRQAGALALTLAFVPVGMVSGALVSPEDETLTVARGEQPAGAAGFDPLAVRAPLSRHSSLAADVRGPAVRVYRRPDAGGRFEVLRARELDGRQLPLVLLVRGRRRGWLHVDLPTRPNFSSGWILARRADVRANPYRLRVELGRHRLTVLRAGRRIARHRIGVGRALSPTPTGRYYLTDLVRPPSPDGIYGAYAFGLSGHSPVLTSFGTGDGQIGLHGTNDPSGLGQDVSSGCIRVRNRVIRRLARRVPLGTPVVIRR